MSAERRRFLIPQPFTDGYVPDLTLELLGPKMAARLEECIFPRGIAERRRGWTFDGTTADTAAGTSVGVARVQFQRQGATRTLVSAYLSSGGTDGEILIHNSAAAGTSLGSHWAIGNAVYLPRGMYRDELIFCAQDGFRPLLRYSGLSISGFFNTTATAGTHKYAGAGQRTIAWTGGSAFGQDMRGGFSRIVGPAIPANASLPHIFARLSKAVNATREYTLEKIRASGASVLADNFSIYPIGYAAPSIPVYQEGTTTVAGTTVTGQGTRWNTGVEKIQDYDCYYANPVNGATTYLAAIGTVSSDTSLTNTTFPAFANAASYVITRRMPFKDIMVFRGCFCGIGVYNRDATLWFCAPGQDIGVPPKYLNQDLDPTVDISSTNPSVDFLTEFVEVPSRLDGDPIMACLATETAGWLPKRGSCYRLTGDYPDFIIDRASDEAGCLDIRSAIVDEYGPFWAGALGVWTVRGGRPYNLCGGPDRPGILTEWRNLIKEGITGPTAGSTSWIACGVAEGHLIVSVRTASGTERCYVYDLRNDRWCGKFLNTLPRFMWSSRVPGEQDKCFGVQDLDARRVEEFSSMFRSPGAGASGAGPTTDGDGYAPLLVAHTGSRVFFPEEISREYRLSQLKIEAKAYDTATPTTTIAPTIAYGAQIDQAADATLALATFDADTANAVLPREYRPGTRARRQQLQIAQTDQDADFSTLEIHELSGYVRVFGAPR